MGSRGDDVGTSRRQQKDNKRLSCSRVLRRARQIFLFALIMGVARNLGDGLATHVSEQLLIGIERAAASLRELELKQVLMLAVWSAELVMGCMTMLRLKNFQDRRFATTLTAYSAATCGYYFFLCVLGHELFMQYDFRHVLLTCMSLCLFDLAGQNKRLPLLAEQACYALLFAIVVASFCGSAPWQIHSTTLLAVYCASLAGWAWRDRLSPVALFFWCVFVVTLSFRSKTMLASDDWNLLYFSLLNSRWVTLSERCRRRATVLPTQAIV